MTRPSEERPILVVLGSDDDPGEAIVRLLGRREVRRYRLPAPWELELADLDPTRGLPDVRTITLENLADVLDTLLAQATRPMLDRLVDRVWRSADEQVRSFYLERGLGKTVAAILKMAPRTVDQPPPPRFVEDRIHDTGFEAQYRLEASPGDRNPLAPAEEASIVLYPFDPTNATGRREAGLPEGPEVVLEVFAYDDGRARHLEFLRAAALPGWRVLDGDDAEATDASGA